MRTHKVLQKSIYAFQVIVIFAMIHSVAIANDQCRMDCGDFVAGLDPNSCADRNSANCTYLRNLVCSPDPNPFPAAGANNLDRMAAISDSCNKFKAEIQEKGKIGVVRSSSVLVLSDLLQMSKQWIEVFNRCNIDEEHSSICLINVKPFITSVYGHEAIINKLKKDPRDPELIRIAEQLSDTLSKLRDALIQKYRINP